MANVYFVEFSSKRRIVAEDEEEAKEIYMRKFQLGEEDLTVTFVRKDDSPFIKKHANGVAESMYLDTGVTGGIV